MVAATLIHEMVHLYNIKQGIQDRSRGGTYHNKKFKGEAEKYMIRIEKHENCGRAITTPINTLLECVLSQGWEEFQMNRHPLGWLRAGNRVQPRVTSASRQHRKRRNLGSEKNREIITFHLKMVDREIFISAKVFSNKTADSTRPKKF